MSDNSAIIPLLWTLFVIVICIILLFIVNSMFIDQEQDFTKLFWNILFGIIVVTGLFQFFYMTDSMNVKTLKNVSFPSIQYDDGETDTCITSLFKNDEILGDFHILGSHNSCVTTSIDDGFVSTEMLEHVISMGIRYVDLEIYSIKGQTVVSAGNKIPESGNGDSMCMKTAYNELPIRDVLKSIYKKAFDSKHGNKPMFVQFRIKSEQKRVYQDLAEAISKEFKERILEPRYGFNCEKLVLSGSDYIENQPMKNFKERIIVVVHDPNEIIKGTPLYEFANIVFPKETIYRSDIVRNFSTSKSITKATTFKTQFSCILPSIKRIAHYDFTKASKIGFHAMCINIWKQDIASQKLVKNIFYINGGVQSFVKRNRENRAERVVIQAESEALPGSNLPNEKDVDWFGKIEKYKTF